MVHSVAYHVANTEHWGIVERLIAQEGAGPRQSPETAEIEESGRDGEHRGWRASDSSGRSTHWPVYLSFCTDHVSQGYWKFLQLDISPVYYQQGRYLGHVL